MALIFFAVRNLKLTAADRMKFVAKMDQKLAIFRGIRAAFQQKNQKRQSQSIEDEMSEVFSC